MFLKDCRHIEGGTGMGDVLYVVMIALSVLTLFLFVKVCGKL